MTDGFLLTGNSPDAPFTLKAYRGDGMVLLAMNWKNGEPPQDFVGFAIEYKEPGGDRTYALENRLGFPTASGNVDPNRLSTLRSPIQKFRWVHFPRNANLRGEFAYKVTPVFMNTLDKLSYGAPQEVTIELRRETHPGILNVAFTRGFISSQAFVDKFKTGEKLLPLKAKDGLTFKPSHPKKKDAYPWMGFEAREAILGVLDEAIADHGALVRVVAYDLNEPEIVSRLKQLGGRLMIIIDDEGDHGKKGSAENQAAGILGAPDCGAAVKRQHMGKLQHNKTIVVDAPGLKRVVCGSTNFSWRGIYVQANNAVVLQGAEPVRLFLEAFDTYWNNETGFASSAPASWSNLDLPGLDARVTFSPHGSGNGVLEEIARDIREGTSSTLFYSLAFLAQTPGVVRDAIAAVTKKKDRFVYGMADRKIGGGLSLQKPDGNRAPVYPAALSKNLPEPFKSEPTGGGGTRMHHKFVVIDFDKPSGRVYLGSYNFSRAADSSNGENLLLIRDQRVAVSYAVEALTLFDHYHFRVKEAEAKKKGKGKLLLARPPRKEGEVPWWREYYEDPQKKRDRELFA